MRTTERDRERERERQREKLRKLICGLLFFFSFLLHIYDTRNKYVKIKYYF